MPGWRGRTELQPNWLHWSRHRADCHALRSPVSNVRGARVRADRSWSCCGPTEICAVRPESTTAVLRPALSQHNCECLPVHDDCPTQALYSDWPSIAEVGRRPTTKCDSNDVCCLCGVRWKSRHNGRLAMYRKRVSGVLIVCKTGEPLRYVSFGCVYGVMNRKLACIWCVECMSGGYAAILQYVLLTELNILLYSMHSSADFFFQFWKEIDSLHSV